MVEILTIDDMLVLQKEDPDFLAEVAQALSLSDIYHAVDNFAGKEVGHNDASYDRFMRERVPHTCPACSGTGQVLPKARSVGHIHPSSANACVLRLYNDVIAVQRTRQEHSPGLRVTFDFGHVVHARVQRALTAAAQWDTEAEIERRGLEKWDPWTAEARKIGEMLAPLDFEFEDEVRVDLPEALIDGGHADGRFGITLVAGRERVRVRGVLEIKTAGEKDFPKITKPKDDHQVQANGLYANALDCPFTVFLYFAKVFDFNQVLTREFVTTFSPKIYEDWCRRKLDPVERAIASGVPPTADASSYECRQCGYGHGCSQKRGGSTRSGRTVRR